MVPGNAPALQERERGGTLPVSVLVNLPPVTEVPSCPFRRSLCSGESPTGDWGSHHSLFLPPDFSWPEQSGTTSSGVWPVSPGWPPLGPLGRGGSVQTSGPEAGGKAR